MTLTRYAVYRRLAAGAIAALLVVLGLYGLSRLPMDYLPSITYPLIKVEIQWEGAAPPEVEKNIAEPVERMVSTVDRLDHIESSSMAGLYSLDIHFEYGADIDVAFQDVMAALARARGRLPEDVGEPYAFKADPSQIPVMQLTVSSDRWDPVRLRDWVEDRFQDRVLAVSGVAGTDIVGGLEREIRIRLDPEALEKHDLALDDIVDRVAAENIELSAGRVTVGPREIIARTMGAFETIGDIREIVVAADGYQKVRLGDIADVDDGHGEARVVTRFNGETCVRVSVLAAAEANIVDVADSVNRELAAMAPGLPAGITLGYVEDQSVYVRQALESVRNAALAAAVLLIVVIYLFLGSLRQVGVMLIALPLTLVINFGLMTLAGFSLNMFSLGGLVVAIGVVLDNSVVVVENITRLKRADPGREVRETAVYATGEVGPALIAATLSFLALFVPFLIVPGLASLLFRELILVIAGIVVVSLLVAVTVTPMLATLFLGKTPEKQPPGRFERFFERLAEGYGRLLDRVIGMRWVVIPVFLLVLAAGILLAGRLGGEFLPLMDDGRIMIRVNMPTGASVAETDRRLAKIEARIAEDPLIESMFTFSGGRVMGITTREIANRGEIYIQMVPRRDRDVTTGEYASDIRRRIRDLQPPGGRAMARQVPIRGIPGIRAADVIVKVRGPDMETLSALAEETSGVIRQMDDFRSVRVDMDLTQPEYQVIVDRTRAAEMGVPVADVARSLRSLITGAVPTQFREGERYYDIRVLVPEDRLTEPRDVENLVLTTRDGKPVRLRDIARVVPETGPVEIMREDQVRQITVDADIDHDDLAGAVSRLEASLADMDLPDGYTFDLGGSAEMMIDMKAAVFAVLAFSLFFSFVVLTVQFNSLKLPLLILGSVPVCFAGVVFLMLLAGLPLGATVIIGVLVVVAATVSDGVLLLTYAGEIRDRENVSPRQAVVSAARIRLRPRMMTTMTTIMGFLPLALNLTGGGEMLQPMAVAAIGGLLMEIPVALFLMPCLYVIANRMR